MNQTEARDKARTATEETGDIYIADTVCALRGEFEQGPDANKWVVVGPTGEIEGP